MTRALGLALIVIGAVFTYAVYYVITFRVVISRFSN